MVKLCQVASGLEMSVEWVLSVIVLILNRNGNFLHYCETS